MDKEEAPVNVEMTQPSAYNLKRKPLISPTSSFVDFAELETEIWTEEDKANESSYDPYSNRKIKKPVSDFSTVVHLLKGSIGAGVLAIPRAYYNAGVAIAVPGTILITALATYGIHVMLKMQKLQCHRLRVPFITLTRSMKLAFLNGPKPLHKIAWMGPLMVDFFLVGNQIGLCATYINFMASSLKRIVEPNIIEEMDIRIYILSIFFPVLIINFLRNLRRLTPVSLIADLLIISALCCCFYIIFTVGSFKTEEARWVAPVTTWPLFLGTVIFAVEAVGVMIALEHNMKKPQHFLGRTGIFPWCMVAIMSLYMGVGLLSYLKYGDNIGETIVTSLPKDNKIATCVQAMIGLAIYGSYPLQCFVGLEIIWGNYVIRHIKNHDREFIYEYIMRILVVSTTFLIAVVIPHVDLVISLVGALCMSMLGVVIPFMLEMLTLWPDRLGACKYVVIKDIVFIIIGLLIFVTGTYCSLYSIIVPKD